MQKPPIKYRTGRLEVERARPSQYARELAADTAWHAEKARQAAETLRQRTAEIITRLELADLERA